MSRIFPEDAIEAVLVGAGAAASTTGLSTTALDGAEVVDSMLGAALVSDRVAFGVDSTA